MKQKHKIIIDEFGVEFCPACESSTNKEEIEAHTDSRKRVI